MNFKGEYRLENIRDGGYWGYPFEADIIRASDNMKIGEASGGSLRALKRHARWEVQEILRRNRLRGKVIDL